MSERIEYISKTVKRYAGQRIFPHIEFRNCGKVVLKEWRVPMRSLPLWHIYRNSAPGGVLILPEREIAMAPEKIYLLPPDLMFATASDGVFEHAYLDFLVRGSWFSRLRKEVLVFPAGEFAPLLDRCFREGFSALAAGALIFSLLDRIGAEYFTEEGDFLIDPRIQRALDLISAALRKGKISELSNGAISRRIGMSPVNFLHLFKRELKLSPHRYILNRRLQLAHDLLENRELSIAEVAEAAGFANRYQFTKSFSGMYGMPPGRWRRK